MPNPFDPYHRWLGIPPEKQPPNHYVLLAVEPFEHDPDVIEAAADRQMGHLRTYQMGKRSKLSQKLLNEVAAAKICLLNGDKKAAYDRQLREILPAKLARLADAPQNEAELYERETLAQPMAADAKKPPVRTRAKSAKPDRLGEYQILEKLGEGGMGTVYKALHTKLKREVALKVLREGRIENEKAVARFEREMMAVGQLDHSNIVRAHDAREVDGACFLVMELVEGLNLAQLVKRDGPLGVADACEVIRQAALALQYAHEHGMVHRDVKPSNLMLTPAGQVKLLDLGLARFRGQPAGEEMTATEQALGTLDYMAPEQVSDARTVDIRADIYSLGCTLYKLLCGRAPFADAKYDSPFHKMRAHLQRPPPPMRRFRKDVPEELAAVVNRMLAKDPSERFATPGKVADAVGAFAADAELSGLLAGRGRKAPVVRPSRALSKTESSSSGLTRFLRGMKPGRGKRPEAPPADEESAWTKPVIIAGSALVGILLVGIVVALVVRSRVASPGRPVLVFDWPAEQRREVKLDVDGQRFTFPGVSGAMEHECAPGEHRILARRPGFKPYEEKITLEAGQRLKIVPDWEPLCLVLKWPEAQRSDARLEIDGRVQDLADGQIIVTAAEVRLPIKEGRHTLRITWPQLKTAFEQRFSMPEAENCSIAVTQPEPPPVTYLVIQRPREVFQDGEVEIDDQLQDLSAPGIEALADCVKIPLEPGLHKLWIAARGMEPFLHPFTIVKGEDVTVRPPGLPVPAEEVQEEIARRIDQQYGVAKAETAEAKLALAKSLLDEGRKTQKDPNWRYGLFDTAMDLANNGRDKPLMLQAAAAIEAYFDVSVPDFRNEAIAGFDPEEPVEPGNGPPPPGPKSYADEINPIEILVAAGDYRTAVEQLAGVSFEDPQLAQRLDAYRKKITGLAEYAAALRPAEELVAGWDFLGAAAELAKVEFADPELAERLKRRGREVLALAELKARIIEKINQALPRLTTFDMGLRGIKRSVAKADEQGITVELAGGKTESHVWAELSEKARSRLVALAIDPNEGVDCLTAALLALACHDHASAERLFEQARALDINIDRYLAPLATAAFARAWELLNSNDFSAADTALSGLEKKYGKTPWFDEPNTRAVAALRAEARTRITETEAEKLYTEAAKLFEENELFPLKPLVEKLRTSYPNTRPVTDLQRKSLLAEMEKAVEGLGKWIIVRQDGKGDFKSIQQAILAAAAKSLIEVHDRGPYREEIIVPSEKEGLTIRGKEGCWPIFKSPRIPLTVEAPGVSLERLILLGTNSDSRCLHVRGVPVRVRSCVVGKMRFERERGSSAEQVSEIRSSVCFRLTEVKLMGIAAKDSVWLNGAIERADWYEGPSSIRLDNVVMSTLIIVMKSDLFPSCDLRHCTIPTVVRLEGQPNVLVDSIIDQVESLKEDTRIEYCNVFGGGYKLRAKRGKGCFSEDPQFADPGKFDYRLKETSPCIGKASDGGDVGCRYTPEMVEMLELAFKLRSLKLIEF